MAAMCFLPRYQIASISKTFTTAMLFKLRDEGKLPAGLDTPVSTLLPSFYILSRFRSTRPITLRALAMHASGLPRETPECPGCSQSQILARIAELEQLCEQFGGTHYSNLGIALLGRALEVPAGKSWERYVVEELMAPLGMVNSGPPPADNVAMADGVDPVSGALIPPPTKSSWDAPCGLLHSTPKDMAIWMNFLLGADGGDPTAAARFDAVLDPATRAEMLGTAALQGDAISAVGAGTFEMAFSAGRWTANKLGCLGGYRSAMTVVPSLGLGVFGVATSTCDLYGDGDAVSFPVVSALVPVIERVLEARVSGWFLPPPELIANVTGLYCSTDPQSPDAFTIGIEHLGSGDHEALVVRPSATGSTDYPFVLQYQGNIGLSTRFRAVMGPDHWLPQSWPGCSASRNGTELNLCPISCMRKLARGSGAVFYFDFDFGSGPAGRMRWRSQEGGLCYRYGPKPPS